MNLFIGRLCTAHGIFEILGNNVVVVVFFPRKWMSRNLMNSLEKWANIMGLYKWAVLQEYNWVSFITYFIYWLHQMGFSPTGTVKRLSINKVRSKHFLMKEVLWLSMESHLEVMVCYSPAPLVIIGYHVYVTSDMLYRLVGNYYINNPVWCAFFIFFILLYLLNFFFLFLGQGPVKSI